MSTVTPGPAPSTKTVSARLIFWSWTMPIAFVVVWFILGLVTFASLGLFGLHEGDLVLMAHSWSAWVFFVVCWAVIAAAPAAGVVLATMALRRQHRSSAWAALVVNALIALLVAYQLFDEIRMSYFPHWTWPF